MALVGIAVVALVLRLVELGARPMHHDESLDAWWSWRFFEGMGHEYDPAYHGPLRFYLTAAFYGLIGETEATARLLAALCGAGLVLLVGTMRRWLGLVGALTAAVLFAVSPSMLYFSRFGREDLHVALCELALLAIVASWLTRPASWHPAAFGAVLAAAFALKETTFIVVAVLGTYLGLMWLGELLDRRAGRPVGKSMSVTGGIGALGWRAWAQGGAVFAFVFAALFSVGFTDLGGISAGAFDGIDYWLSQQPVNRGSQPWPYYLALLVGYEWPILVLAAVGTVVALRRLDPVRGLIVWTAVANLVIYSWASERFPWLVVHPLLPIILLAGLGAQGIWNRARSSAPGRVGFAASAVAAVVALLVLAVPPVYRDPSSSHHLLVSVQTHPDVLWVRERVDQAFEDAVDTVPVVVVDTGEGATWPWAWYLRDRPIVWADLAVDPEAAVGADLVLVLASNVDLIPGGEDSWVRTPYVHRLWWLPPWDDASAGDWFGWLAVRRPFGEPGELSAYVLEPAAP